MTATAALLVLVLTLAFAVVWWKKYGGYMPEPFRSRPCQGMAWKRAFPHESSDDLRRFLRLVADSFAFRETQKLQVKPEDKVMDVYRAIYPHSGWMDSLELETLANAVERQYKVNFNEVWNLEITFGSLFHTCRTVPRLANHDV